MPCQHLGLIMDGNRRWARARGLSVADGYRAGAKALFPLLSLCVEQKIPYVSVFALSTDNVRLRSKGELQAIGEQVLFFLSNLQGRSVAVRFTGDVLAFSADFCAKSQELIDIINAECSPDATLLNICLNYGGKEELLLAAQKLRCENTGKLSVEDFENALQSRGLPALDAVVRTGGKRRLSNFMIYSAAYAELFFSDKLWPDFSESDLLSILLEYDSRQRTFGGNA